MDFIEMNLNTNVEISIFCRSDDKDMEKSYPSITDSLTKRNFSLVLFMNLHL